MFYPMDDLSCLKAALEGIKEALEDIDHEDLYYQYGRIIALGYLDFSEELMNDPTVLHKVLRKYIKNKKESTIDW